MKNENNYDNDCKKTVKGLDQSRILSLKIIIIIILTDSRGNQRYQEYYKISLCGNRPIHVGWPSWTELF